MKLIDRMKWWHVVPLMIFASTSGNIVREIRHEHAIADTHPQGGDAKQAPFMSGGGAKQSPNTPLGTPPE